MVLVLDKISASIKNATEFTFLWVSNFSKYYTPRVQVAKNFYFLVRKLKDLKLCNLLLCCAEMKFPGNFYHLVLKNSATYVKFFLDFHV